MKKATEKKYKRILLIFVLLVIAAGFFIASVLFHMKSQKLEQASYVMAGETGKIQYALDSRILDTEILEMIIVDENGTINDFENIASRLYEKDSSIRSIQLAPNGVVSYIYPLKGNEEGFGDLMSDPKRKTEAEQARDTGETTLAGPFELYQGGLGVAARTPIYIDHGGKQEFWGFSIVVMDVPEIFERAELDNLVGQGYSYKIWRTDPETDKPQMIKENDEAALTEPIVSEISVPNGTWYLSIAPTDGWITWKDIVSQSVAALVICVLVTLAVYNFMMTELQRKRLALLVNTDSLTSIYNARHYITVLKALVHEGKPFGLLYLDLDKFKSVNDEHGHDIGDKLLIEIAARIKGCIREMDYPFRIGGDEFSIIVLEQEKESFYIQLVERLKTEVEKPFFVDGTELYPRLSCGYARFPLDQTNVDELIKQADQKMYAEKRTKKMEE